MALLLLAAAGAAYAGFDLPKDKPDACKVRDAEPLGKAGTYPQTTIDKLKAAYGIGDAAAKAKLDAMRKNINKAKDLVEAEDAAIGKCLKDACASGRLCIEFKYKDGNASTLPDGTANCDKDLVNVGINRAGCAEFSCYDPQLFRLFTSLLHEGKHMIQVYAVAANDPDPFEVLPASDAADCKEKVKKAKKSACNEIEAEELENGVIDKMKDPLKKIAAGMPPGPLPGGAAGKLIMAVQAAPDPKEAAKDLLDEICKTKAGNDAHIECQKARKAAFDAFLASGGSAADKTAMNDAIKKTRWFSIFPGNPNWGPIVAVTTGGGTGGKVGQTTGGNSQEFETGLARATAYLPLTPTTSLVAGVDANEIGVLLRYDDLDGDAFLDESSRTELLTSTLLQGGLALTHDGSSGSLLVFEAENNRIYRVLDVDGDGVPETLDPVPVALDSASLENAHSFVISDGGRELYGSFFGMDDALPIGTEMLLLSDTDGDGFFETETTLDVFQSAAFPTGFVGGAVAGSQQAVLHAPYRALVEVHRVDPDGNSLGLLGMGQANAIGDLTVNLSQRLVLGSFVALQDRTNAILGPPIAVVRGAASTLVPSTGVVRSGGSQDLAFEGGPRLAGMRYLLVGSMTGTEPGMELGGGVHLPLVWDAYSNLTVRRANSGPFVGTMGVLDASGSTRCSLSFGALKPSLAGLTIYHSLVVLDEGRPRMASEPVCLTFLP